MTITSTSLGSYTTQITLTNETSSTNMITSLDATIVAAGWTQYDVFNNGTRRIYRALNKDSVTFKYIDIFIDIATWKIGTSSWETWNPSTHTGTNEAANSSRFGACGFSLSSSDIVIMVSNRWCIIQSFIRGQASQWSGVVELQREASEDTAAAGYPCHVWITSGNPLAPSMVRTRGNLTSYAAMATSIQTPYVRLTPATGSTLLNNYVTYPWDTSKRIVHSMRPTTGFTEVHGRMYGMKAIYAVGSPYSRIAVNIDSEFNYSSTGSAAEHWVLGDTASSSPIPFLVASGPANQYMQPTLLANASGSSIPYSITTTGQYYYIAHNTGVTKIDAGVSMSILNPAIAGISGQVHDITFDGKYVYASTTTGISRIDPVTDVVSSLALTNGGSSIYYDGTNIWVGSRGSRANNVIYKIDPNTFTLVASIVVTSATSTQIGGMATDFNGNLYITTLEVSIYKLVISTGVLSIFVGAASTIAYASNIMFDGTNLIIGVHSAGTNYPLISGMYSLIGTPMGSSYSVPALQGQIAAAPKASLLKYDRYCIIGGFSSQAGPQSNIAYSAFNSLTGNLTTGGSINTSNLALANSSAINCDGNKIYGVSATGNLFVYNYIYHADEPSVIHGRFLLPK